MLMSLVDILFMYSFPLFLSNFTKDTDKCKAFFGKCHKEATCINTHGSHVCVCKPGYIGDGHNCIGTVNNLRSLHIIFEYNDNFLFSKDLF